MAAPNRPVLDLAPDRIAAWRAHSQRLRTGRHAAPLAAFRHLGAVQSQEYHPSKLTPAMRTEPGAGGAFAPAADVDALLDTGAVVRTHVLRPTWHTVPAEDARMMLAATAGRVHQLMGTMNRRLGLDAAVLVRGDEVLAAASAGGRHLAREEASEALAEAGIADPTGMRLIHLLMHAELEAAVCSGTPKGNQQTYANFDERVPAGSVDREDAIRELARRFFVSRGPATVKDFTKWASLKVADAEAALADLGFESAVIDGRTCYFEGGVPEPEGSGPVVDFVQGFDEMMCSYMDTKDWVRHWSIPAVQFPDRPRFTSVILLDGQVVGHWKATLRKERVAIETYRLRGFTAAEIAAMRRGADRLREWYGRPEMDLGLDHA